MASACEACLCASKDSDWHCAGADGRFAHIGGAEEAAAAAGAAAGMAEVAAAALAEEGWRYPTAVETVEEEGVGVG